MITLQRKLLIRVRDQKVEAGKAPQAMKPNTFYPVVGYSVQLVKREKTGEHEEITGFYFINQRDEISFVYASYCEISLDPCVEQIANTETYKEGRAADGKTEGSGQEKK